MAIPVLESTSYNSTATTSMSVPYPTGIVEGDIIIGLYVMSFGSGFGGWDTGWNLVTSQHGPDTCGSGIFYKIADGTESGTSLSVTKANVNWYGEIRLLRVSGLDVDDPVHLSSTRGIDAPVSTDYAPSVGVDLANSFAVAVCSDADSLYAATPSFPSVGGTQWLNLWSRRYNATPSYFSFAFATQVAPDANSSTGSCYMSAASSSAGYSACTAVFNPLTKRRIFIT